jgi:TetR/AcrR family transcriptional regulator, cholesterol catabolism regulator
MSRKSTPQDHGSQTKDKILNASADLFQRQGYQASTLREIATISGIKGGSVYHHFSSKQEILLRIMDSTMDALIEEVRTGIANKKDPLDQLKVAIGIHMRFHLNHLEATYVTDTELRSLTSENLTLIMKKRKQYEEIFRTILQQALRRKQITMSALKLLSFAVLQMCTGLSLWFRQGGEMTIEEVIEQYYGLIISGLGAGQD